jgi:hypothetical protein
MEMGGLTPKVSSSTWKSKVASSLPPTPYKGVKPTKL